MKPWCRFRCVSKPWHSVLSDPKFIAKHSDAVFQRRRLVFTDSICPRLYSLDLDRFLHQNHSLPKNPNAEVNGGLEEEAIALDFVYDQFGKGNVTPYVCSCNNLLLASQKTSRGGSFCLVNPTTKESKKLPDMPNWREFEGKMVLDWKLIGFGFDHSTNEYKLVTGQVNEAEDKVVFSVYTMTNSWRRIEGVFPYIPRHLDGSMVNGCAHWLVRRVADNYSLVIISFTLADEQVREIPVPVIDTYRETCNEFWVMKEYGVRESWTKMRVSIPYYTLSHSGFWRESHDLMVFDRSSLVLYNFYDDRFLTLPFGGKDAWFGSFGTYVESLSFTI